MNKRIRKMWLKTLRSGEYNQCSGVLRVGENNFCCLGALSRLHAQENSEVGFVATESGGWVFESSMGLAEQETLICDTEEWSGLKPVYSAILSEMNDGGASFDEIADYIEEHL